MQMAAGRTTCAAHPRDLRATRDLLAKLDVKSRQVGITGYQTISVRDFDRISIATL